VRHLAVPTGLPGRPNEICARCGHDIRCMVHGFKWSCGRCADEAIEEAEGT
jgi:ribosomal protein S27AE